MISGCQEDIELKLSQRPQVLYNIFISLSDFTINFMKFFLFMKVKWVAASISKLIETLETRVANVKLLRKMAKTDPKVSS